MSHHQTASVNISTVSKIISTTKTAKTKGNGKKKEKENMEGPSAARDKTEKRNKSECV